MHMSVYFFFFNDTATTEIYTLSLHDALPISRQFQQLAERQPEGAGNAQRDSECWVGLLTLNLTEHRADRKSTRLNSSHSQISYAVFCLKKKKKEEISKHLVPSDRSSINQRSL